MPCMQEQGFTAEGPKESAEALREETKEAAGQDADSLETAAGISALELSCCSCNAQCLCSTQTPALQHAV